MTTIEPGVVSALPYLKLDPEGDHHLVGSRCPSCGAVLLGERLACAACCATGGEIIRLSDSGRLRTYTIVYRSYPGVEVPFVAAVVDLDGGGTLRGTLRGVPADPAHLPAGLPISVVIEDSGQRDAAGRVQLCHVFRLPEVAA